MPSRLSAPVLKVDANLIHKVDTRNVENLFSMWTGEFYWRVPAHALLTHLVFSKCSGSIEEGRRLENLSWRLWNRETFCCEPGEANATTPVISISQRSSEGQYAADVPELSGSVDSLADEDAIEFDSEETTSTSHPLTISRPRIQRHDSGSNRSRGRERHITPDDLEKMVITIKEKKDLEPLEMNAHSYLAPLAAVRAPTPVPAPQAADLPVTPTIIAPTVADNSADCMSDKASPAVSTSSAGSGVSEHSTTSVVRGFSDSPSHVLSSFRSIAKITEPQQPSSMPKSILAVAPRPSSTKPLSSKRIGFTLGGGSSQSETDSFMESSMEGRLQPQPQPKKKQAVFTVGGSSNEDENSFRENMQLAPQHRTSLLNGSSRPLQPKKQTSFLEEVATRTIHEDRVMDEDPFETDDEDEIDESAIDDDDDSSDWEDSVEESGKSSIDDKTFFQRVDSRLNLVSRRSMLTTLLNEKDRASALANDASKSTPAMLQRSRTSTPKGPSMPASVESNDEAPLMMKKGLLRPGQEVLRTAPQPIIMTTTNNTPHHAALSPKTTRRNMLQTELTASLRRNLLWERQQKNQTATAVLKRRHTTMDIQNLKQYPEKSYMGAKEEDKDGAGSWNQYFGQGLGDFHSKGW
jgi:hypothetical protein